MKAVIKAQRVLVVWIIYCDAGWSKFFVFRCVLLIKMAVGRQCTRSVTAGIFLCFVDDRGKSCKINLESSRTSFIHISYHAFAFGFELFLRGFRVWVLVRNYVQLSHTTVDYPHESGGDLCFSHFWGRTFDKGPARKRLKFFYIQWLWSRISYKKPHLTFQFTDFQFITERNEIIPDFYRTYSFHAPHKSAI